MLHVHPFALPYKVLPLRLKITYKGFPTWREKQLKGMEICGFATYKFRNSITTEILTMLQIGTNPTALPIGIGSRLRYRRPSECLLCPIWVRIPVILPTVILCLCLKSWQTWIRCQTVVGIYRHRLTWEPQMLQALSIHVCALSSGYYDLRRYTDREAAFIVFESQPALCA